MQQITSSVSRKGISIEPRDILKVNLAQVGFACEKLQQNIHSAVS